MSRNRGEHARGRLGVYGLSAVLLAGVIIAAWYAIHLTGTDERQMVVIALLTAGATCVVVTLLGLRIESGWRRLRWFDRIEHHVLGVNLQEPGRGRRPKNPISDPIQLLLGPLADSNCLQPLVREFENAGLGYKPAHYLAALVLVTLAGMFVGFGIGSWPLAALLTLIAHMPLRAWVRARGESNRAKLAQQVPSALDTLAGAIGAGLSIRQAFRFAAEEVPPPLGNHFARAVRFFNLGHSTTWVLRRVLEAQPDEGLRLAFDGLGLMSEVGGNVVEMLETSADLVRERVDLELEVRSTLAQSRLSAWVVGGLAPVSAGFLLITNPAYIDVLFETLPGQFLLVTSILLQVFGWLVIRRLTSFDI